MKEAKQLNILHWSGDAYTIDPSDELRAEFTIDEGGMAAIWGFKIFESLGSVATQASEDDMAKYRALASILGAGRVTDCMRRYYWFEGRELAVLYAALCNLQTQFIDKSRMNMEKTLMRIALEQPEPETAINNLRCSIKCQASMMVSNVAQFMGMVDGALHENHRILLSVA